MKDDSCSHRRTKSLPKINLQDTDERIECDGNDFEVRKTSSKFVLVRIPIENGVGSRKVAIPENVLEKPESFLPLIGQGSFGEVYLYKDVIASLQVAIKKIQINLADLVLPSSPDQTIDLKNIDEIRVHKNLNHPNIVQYYEVHQGDYHLSIILEFADQGSLKNRLQKLKDQKQKLNDDAVIFFVRQILSGLQYLHSRPKPIIHRDLRSANILLFSTNNYKVKIADFGISKQLETLATSSGFSSVPGNSYWKAPEMIEYSRGDLGRGVDIWSLGIMIIEMYYINPVHHMFNMDNYRYTYNLCSKKDIPELPEFADKRLQRIIKMCLVYKSKDRATAEEILTAINDNENAMNVVKKAVRVFPLVPRMMYRNSPLILGGVSIVLHAVFFLRRCSG